MMNQEQLKQTRAQLYKATHLKLQLVDELTSKIKKCFGNKIEITSIGLDVEKLKMEGLSVKMIEIDPQKIGGVLVHWYPKPKISTQQDPYCSAYILKPCEIRKIMYHIDKIHEYYAKNEVISSTNN